MNRARIFGGILMVASVAIGAGMLALPIATGYAGFWPATWMMCAAFVYMVICLMLCLEANLTCPEGSNIISMVGETLGPAGQGVAWTSYLLLLYSAVAAYISGGGDVVAKMVNWHYPGYLTQHAATLGLIALVVVLVFAGTRFVDYFNRLLTAGLVVSFIALLFFVLPAAEPEKLAHSQPQYVWSALPLLLLSFTSHLMVPSLRTYLHGHVRALLWVLLAGSVIPLIMYMAWEYTILGILPVTGPDSLLRVFESHDQVSTMVSFVGEIARSGAHLQQIVGYFSFFALITSFIGAALSLCHFLIDGLGLQRRRMGTVWGVVLTFVPPTCFAWFYPAGFTVALSYAGVFVAILFCFLPVLMVWQSRYRWRHARSFRVWGGRPLLLGVAAIALGVMVIQVLSQLNYLPHIQ